MAYLGPVALDAHREDCLSRHQNQLFHLVAGPVDQKRYQGTPIPNGKSTSLSLDQQPAYVCFQIEGEEQ